MTRERAALLVGATSTAGTVVVGGEVLQVYELFHVLVVAAQRPRPPGPWPPRIRRWREPGPEPRYSRMPCAAQSSAIRVAACAAWSRVDLDRVGRRLQLPAQVAGLVHGVARSDFAESDRQVEQPEQAHHVGPDPGCRGEGGSGHGEDGVGGVGESVAGPSADRQDRGTGAAGASGRLDDPGHLTRVRDRDDERSQPLTTRDGVHAVAGRGHRVVGEGRGHHRVPARRTVPPGR